MMGKVLRRPPTSADFTALTGMSFAGGGAYYAFDEASGHLLDATDPKSLLYKAGGTAAFDNSIGSSNETAAGNCYVYATIPWDATTAPAWQVMIGLVDQATQVTLGNTDYAVYWYASTGWLRFWEYGNETDIGATATPGDKIGVRRTGTTVEYLKNDVVIHTSATANSNALRASLNIYALDALVQITYEIAGTATDVTWQATANVFEARDLQVTGAPTFQSVLNGGRGIQYTGAARHIGHVSRIPSTESFIFGAIVTLADAVNQTHVWGSFIGTSYAMFYFDGAATVSWRCVSGAAVHVQVTNPIKDTGQYVVVGQVDRTAAMSRGVVARQGRVIKNEASSVGLGGFSDVFGANTYNAAGGVRIERGWILRGAQCEGATKLDTLAAQLGAA